MKNIVIPHENGLLLNRDIKLVEGNWRSDNVYKFIFCLEGENIFQGKTDIKLIKNNFFIMNPLADHRQLYISEEKFLVELETSFINKISDHLGITKTNDIIFAYHPQTHDSITKWVKFIRDYYSMADSNYSVEDTLFLENSLVQLAILLLKTSIGSHTRDFYKTNFNNSHQAISLVISALKEGYNETWTLAKMSEIARISKYQFSHLFKEQIGLSPYSWLQLYRLVKSQRLLLESKKSILEIAMDCGFSSINIYNNLFKKVYNISPMFFRNRYASKSQNYQCKNNH